jgi:metal-responsive CopG/Arc/MetJ family transcriptional regulator
MTKTKRVAVTIPEDVLAEVERLREQQQQSRSTVVTEALLAWLRAQRVDAAEQRYTRGYLAKPENVEGTATVAAESVAVWQPWT